MSDNKPTINVTRGSRGKKNGRSKKKRRSASSSSGSLPSAMDVAQSVAETTRRFWLAGLGAISMAEETGTNVFNALVEEGKSWEQARRERTEAATKQLRRIASEGAETAGAIEERVRDEIDGALERVGVPNRDDIDDLRGQVDDLGRKVDRLAEMLREEREASDE
jgi:poly(hydroxyalkanoate) granule-associated protein